MMSSLVFLGESIPEFLQMIMMMIVLFGPISYAVLTNNDFQENLDWLINYQYNRKQLVIFYITSQSVKLFLTSLIYISYYFISTLVDTKLNKSSGMGSTFSTGTKDLILSSPWHSLIYFVLIIGIFIVFFGSLYKSNSEVIRRQMIINKSSSSSKKISSLLNLKNKSTIEKMQYFIFVLLLAGTFYYEFDIFITTVLVTSAIGLASIRIFNRKFKVLNLKRELFFGYSLSALLVLPYFLFILGAISEITNEKLKISNRITAINFTKLFHKPSKEVIVGLISNNKDCGDFYSLSGILGENSIRSNYIFEYAPKGCSVNKALGEYSKFGIDEDFVVQTQNYIEKNKLSEDAQIMLAAKFYVRGSSKRFSKRIYHNYLEKTDTFTSFLGLRMAKRSLSRKRFSILVKSKIETLNDSVKKLGTVKRAIASLDKKDVKKSKKKVLIDYDRY
jgi:hypothetical protein